MNKALILGITGQDGSYLAELLLEKGYEVHGMIRRSATDNTRNIQHLKDKLTLHQGDLADQTSIHRIINEVRPQELYNEADQDSVSWSNSTPAYSCDITAGAVARMLEAVKQIDKSIKVFQPVSSMMFGEPPHYPQNENTPFAPMSPYACAKAAAYYFCGYYRKVHGLFVSTAILYNHTSERQGEDYLIPKICRSAVRIARGEQDYLAIGNLKSRIDIGYAPEYMLAAWQMLQQPVSDDFIIGSRTSHTIERLVQIAFGNQHVNMGKVMVNPEYWAPTPTVRLQGDVGKAVKTFGFSPNLSIVTLIVKLIISYRKKLQ